MSDPVYVVQPWSGSLSGRSRRPASGSPPTGSVLHRARWSARWCKRIWLSLLPPSKEIGGALPLKPGEKASQEEIDRFNKFAAKLAKLGLPGQDMAQLLGVVGKIAESRRNRLRGARGRRRGS